GCFLKLQQLDHGGSAFETVHPASGQRQLPFPFQAECIAIEGKCRLLIGNDYSQIDRVFAYLHDFLLLAWMERILLEQITIRSCLPAGVSRLLRCCRDSDLPPTARLRARSRIFSRCRGRPRSILRPPPTLLR